MKAMEILEALTDMNDELVFPTEADTSGSKSMMRKFGGVRWLKRAAVAAAAIMLMRISAYAADAVFNDGAIVARISEKITAGLFPGDNRSGHSMMDKKPGYQEDVADHRGQEPVGSVTSNGAIITPISAISDFNVCHLHIRLEAPEGIVLEDLPESRKYVIKSLKVLYGNDETHTLNDVKTTALPDENPTDHVKEFVLELHSDWMFGFVGKKLRITIPGLWVQGAAGGPDKNYECKLFSAEFEFEFPVEHRNEKIVLKDLGVSHYIEKYEFTVNLERVSITPLSLEIRYTATLPEDENVLPDGGYAQIVMKDGTRLTFGDLSHVSDGPDVGYQLINKLSEYHGIDFVNVAREYNLDRTVQYGFDEQLELENIDYIVWCGEKVIDIH